MDGVQAAIDAFNAQTGGNLRSAEDAVPGLGRRRVPRRRGLGPLGHQGRRLRRPGGHRPGRSTSPTTRSGAAAAPTRALSRRRSGTSARTAQTPTALPYGLQVERFRNPGPTVTVVARRRGHHAGRAALRRHALVRRLREPVRQHPRRGCRRHRRPRSTSGPGTSSRRAGTTASSRRSSTASG